MFNNENNTHNDINIIKINKQKTPHRKTYYNNPICANKCYVR